MTESMCMAGRDVVPEIREILKMGGRFELLVSGSSMSPTLKDQRDSVLLAAPQGVLNRNDILFFMRGDGSYVLHRMVGRDSDGRLIMNGDAQNWTERIEPSQVIAVVERIRRRGRWIRISDRGYRMYVELWGLTRPIRPLIFRMWGVISPVVKGVSGRS